MKKYIVVFIVGMVLATSLSVYADDGLEKIEAYLRPSLPITMDRKKVQLESPPVMVDGSTYLKLRDVAALTGLIVNWNEITQTVELATSTNTATQAKTFKEEAMQVEEKRTIEEIDEDIGNLNHMIRVYEGFIKALEYGNRDTTGTQSQLQEAKDKLAELEREKAELLK